MAKQVLLVMLLCACAVSVCHGWFWGRCNPFWSESDRERCSPCRLFSTREVTLVVRNILREPTFEESVKLDCTHSNTLFYMMIEAADTNAVFKFSTTYFGPSLGFFVDAINGLAGNFTLDETWWEILDGNNARTPVGISSYKPYDGETVTFNFTQGFSSH